MKIISHTLEFRIEEPSVISLGKFDGLHEGHRFLLDAMDDQENGTLARILFTFDISPRSLKEDSYKTLLTLEEREEVFLKENVDYLIECPFDGMIRNMLPYEFLSFLTERINVKRIVVGTDFRFGFQRSGSYHDLQKYEKEFGYETVIVNKKQFEGQDISSTRIREALTLGNMDLANKLLGFPYFVKGTVVYGNQIGRTIGVPTANITAAPEKLLPPFGGYQVKVMVEDNEYYGIANVGRKPTIEGEYPVGIETHLFDFEGDLYGKDITVFFLTFIRPEQKFASFDALVEQMNKDIAVTKEAFGLTR